MSSRRCLGHTVCGCHDHTLTELSSLRLPLGNVWQVSRWQPWVEPVGHLAVAAEGVGWGEKSPVGSVLPPLIS